MTDFPKHTVHSRDSQFSNPNHPDLLDPYRDLRKLFRPMKPEEEKQRPYDYGNVNQAQLSVDGYASRIHDDFYSGKRAPDKLERKSYDVNPPRSLAKSAKCTVNSQSQATKPDGWQTFTVTVVGTTT